MYPQPAATKNAVFPLLPSGLSKHFVSCTAIPVRIGRSKILTELNYKSVYATCNRCTTDNLLQAVDSKTDGLPHKNLLTGAYSRA